MGRFRSVHETNAGLHQRLGNPCTALAPFLPGGSNSVPLFIRVPSHLEARGPDALAVHYKVTDERRTPGICFKIKGEVGMGVYI